MSTELIHINPGLLALINGSDNSLLPFVREIVVLECHVAGTSYLDLKEIEPQLKVKDRFILFREPENKHDKFAVAIYTADKYKLGYLPRDRNESVARLLDAGKTIFADLKSKKWQDEWLKLDIGVWLVDK